LSNPVLFSVVVRIWGSTWLAITYQFGEVDPTLSVAYRFLIAAVILFTYCKIKKLSLKLPRHIHIKMAGVGLCLYTLDYTLLYQSQQYLISAIVALMSSGMVYINVCCVNVSMYFSQVIQKHAALLGRVVAAFFFWLVKYFN
jgi:drug/metabolite transporter (DMT)-like permease